MKDRIDFSQLFGVYSRRETASAKVGKPLTSGFRSRALRRFLDEFPTVAYTTQFLDELSSKLSYLYGKWSLSGETKDPMRDIAEFLVSCADDQFFDFLELAFQSPLIWDAPNVINAFNLIRDINFFFQADALPFQLTGLVTRVGNSERSTHRDPTSRSRARIVVDAFPQLISLENDVVHETAVQPTLTLLADPHFKVANQEFLEALADYRKGDFRDSVIKSLSAFESVLKVVCQRKGLVLQGNRHGRHAPH